MYLAVDAVHAALVAGAVPAAAGMAVDAGGTGGKDDLHSSVFDAVTTLSVQYTGQLHAGQAYAAHVWQDESALQCEFADASGETMCSVALGGAFPGVSRSSKL